MSNELQIVVTSWRRPANIPRVIAAIEAQMPKPGKTVLVDNGGDTYGVDAATAARFNEHWRFPDSGIGPPCRFVGAILDYRFKYTLFLDDDLTIGRLAVPHILATAKQLGDKFATIGEIGRILRREGANAFTYRAMDVNRNSRPVRVDITCRAHLVLTRYIAEAFILRGDILEKTSQRDWTAHDDVLLDLGIQRKTGYPSYITATGPPETKIRHTDLPAPEGMYGRPGHIAARSHLCTIAATVGWTPKT